ncbi:hypothetical protein NDU88_001548 [Pleurodeles waltl]|uniref:Uncharacterized protein n=1 Tax=Pleurodeles waltl TaxID=8319 RepID=A0AAV7SCJ4_PLEWA|nr:hypothetical protein NDU88_001548 [Pleurodeles waltl]
MSVDSGIGVIAARAVTFIHEHLLVWGGFSLYLTSAKDGGNVSSTPLLFAAGSVGCPAITIAANGVRGAVARLFRTLGKFVGRVTVGSNDIRGEALITNLDEPDGARGNQQPVGGIILSCTSNGRCSGKDAGP